MAALKSIAQYQAQHMREPVELPLGGGRVVTFPQPSYAEFRRKIAEGEDNIDIMCLFAPEDDRDALREAMESLPPSAVGEIVTDLYAAWGMGNTSASPAS